MPKSAQSKTLYTTRHITSKENYSSVGHAAVLFANRRRERDLENPLEVLFKRHWGKTIAYGSEHITAVRRCGSEKCQTTAPTAALRKRWLTCGCNALSGIIVDLSKRVLVTLTFISIIWVFLAEKWMRICWKQAIILVCTPNRYYPVISMLIVAGTTDAYRGTSSVVYIQYISSPWSGFIFIAHWDRDRTWLAWKGFWLYERDFWFSCRSLEKCMLRNIGRLLVHINHHISHTVCSIVPGVRKTSWFEFTFFETTTFIVQQKFTDINQWFKIKWLFSRTI